jgi:hypothetical protein
MSKTNVTQSQRDSRRNTYWTNDNLDYIEAQKKKRQERRKH